MCWIAWQGRTMTEAVRFYWLRGNAALPLSAIPDGDRNPLRVRRSVVQAHAPAVVGQLEAGRFVTAAWPSDSAIFLILCHPNVAKGSFDPPLVDTKALPQVVLRLREWDDVPQLARLFLAAYGSEVTSPEECVTARRQLIQWLRGHGQAGMAGIVRHYFQFPLGFRSDAVEVINAWRHVLVPGQKEQLDRFLDEAGRRFEGLGWSRDAQLDNPRNRTQPQSSRFYCWVSGQGTTPRVMLCLSRATERRVRGGTYELLDQQGTLADLATEIQRVLGEVLEPAAAAVGAVISYPWLGRSAESGRERAGR